MIEERCFAYSHAGESVFVDLTVHGLRIVGRTRFRGDRHMLIPAAQFPRFLGLMQVTFGED